MSRRFEISNERPENGKAAGGHCPSCGAIGPRRIAGNRYRCTRCGAQLRTASVPPGPVLRTASAETQRGLTVLLWRIETGRRWRWRRHGPNPSPATFNGNGNLGINLHDGGAANA